ncbi:Hypothetical predicted protein [Olea europaea subsp. europaea]|uniref:Transmembrane protein n=1 Tax=Olea europaea subsp. europaea TaxID=158383 RepID=A0A8S0TEW1_OLEEU|nr:Hypothetical predicted protein [Olea europaea subsp. europaea]
MDENKLQRNFIFIMFLIIAFFLFYFHTTAVVSADGDEKEEHYMHVEESKTPTIDAVKRMFSFSKTPSNYLTRVLHYFYPPNLDFRGVDDERAGEEGATEKVKQAVVKSVDKSKTTAQDSAKSAAKFAEEAVVETVNKVKRTLSGDHEEEL